MIFTGKQLTTPTDPSKVIREVRRISREAAIETSELDGIVRGTTLVTNAELSAWEQRLD